MGQKVNPISLRLHQTNRHFDSCWYSDSFYSELITQDLKLHKYLNSILKQLQYPRGRFFIQNFQNKLKIHLFLCKPTASREDRSRFFKLPRPKLKLRLKSSSNFLNSYSFQKKQSIFVSYLWKNFDLNSLGLLEQKQILVNQKNFLIRYSILGFQFHFRVNKYGLGLFPWFIFTYIKYKLNASQNKFQNKKNTSAFVPRAKGNSSPLSHKILVGKSKQDVVSFSFKDINNQDFKTINQRRHKIHRLFFKPQFQSLNKNNSQDQRIQTKESTLSKNTLPNLMFPSQMGRPKANMRKNFILKNSDFREHLESLLSRHFHSNVNTFFYLISQEDKCALFLADEIAYYLEKRVSFRAIKNRIMKELKDYLPPYFQGLRITCSGRVGGKSKKAQRSKTQTFKYGETSLHVFSSKIDFAFKNANTLFGQVGIKVWVCYGLISEQVFRIKA